MPLHMVTAKSAMTCPRVRRFAWPDLRPFATENPPRGRVSPESGVRTGTRMSFLPGNVKAVDLQANAVKTLINRHIERAAFLTDAETTIGGNIDSLPGVRLRLSRRGIIDVAKSSRITYGCFAVDPMMNFAELLICGESGGEVEVKDMFNLLLR